MSDAAIAGGFFAGIGMLILMLTVSAGVLVFVKMMWHWFQSSMHNSRYDSKLSILKESMLDRIAKKRNIDLDKELARKEMTNTNKFKKRIEAELLAELEGRKLKEEKE